MKALFFALALITSATAMAKDSTWLVCSSNDLALNIFESRGPDGASRDTKINLLYGSYDFTGTFNSDDTSFSPDASGFQNIYVNTAAENFEFFSGKIKINYETAKVLLKGDLHLDQG